MSMAVDVVEAVRNLQPTALPMHVVVDMLAHKVSILLSEEVQTDTKTRINQVTSTLAVEVKVSR